MSAAGPVRTPRRILIVDDAEETRAILAIALGTLNDAEIQEASSAESALVLLAREPVDVLVTDVRMGGMTGFELLKATRAGGHWPSCGALVISGETDPDLAQRAAESGANAFFTKPFSAGEVRRAVKSLLESC